MNDQLLTEVNDNLKELISILKGPNEDEAQYLHCIRELVRGNRKPLDAYIGSGKRVPARRISLEARAGSGNSRQKPGGSNAGRG